MEDRNCHVVSILLYLSIAICACSPLSNHDDSRWANDPNYFKTSIRMPDAVSRKPDSLLCHAVKLDDKEAYILKYEPHARREIAHHMMVYGCGNPGSNQPYWPCGEMDDSSDASVCSDGEREIVFAWAMDGVARELPQGVGFRVGGTTRNKYIVIQLHYKKVFTDGFTDNSGVTLHMTFTPQPKQAGYYVLGNTGYIPPRVTGFHLESACTVERKDTIYPIGYRTHSHNLGVVTSGYHIRDGVWTEIGRMSPQLPETFYNVTHPGIDVKFGDILASRCTMSSDRSEPTVMGPANKDEMCNFYIMYYTYKTENLRINYCFRNAQTFHWAQYLHNIPEDASSIHGLPAFTRIDPFADVPSQTHERRFDTSNELMK